MLGDAKSLNRRLNKPDSREARRIPDSASATSRRSSTSTGSGRTFPSPRSTSKEPENQGLVRDLPAIYDLIALALQTDSTRVATLEIGGSFAASDLGIREGYHNLSHHGQRAGEHRPARADRAVPDASSSPASWTSCKSIREPDGDGTLLDSTMVLFGSGMGNANSHTNTDLPIILAGGGFRHGEHKDYPARKPGGACRCESVCVDAAAVRRRDRSLQHEHRHADRDWSWPECRLQSPRPRPGRRHAVGHAAGLPRRDPAGEHACSVPERFVWLGLRHALRRTERPKSRARSTTT